MNPKTPTLVPSAESLTTRAIFLDLASSRAAAEHSARFNALLKGRGATASGIQGEATIAADQSSVWRPASAFHYEGRDVACSLRDCGLHDCPQVPAVNGHEP
jgi:hypothetical protein